MNTLISNCAINVTHINKSCVVVPINTRQLKTYAFDSFLSATLWLVHQIYPRLDFLLHILSAICVEKLCCVFGQLFILEGKKDNVLPYCMRLCGPHFLHLYHLDGIHCLCYVHYLLKRRTNTSFLITYIRIKT